MPRCSSTNLFASYDEPEAEVESEDLSGTSLSVSVRVVRPCGECGEEMAEYTFELEAEVECPTCGTECGGHYGTERSLPDGVLPSDKLPEDHEDYKEYEVEFDLDNVDDPDVSESGGNRYKKNIFTCTTTAHVICNCCEESFEVELSDEAAASSFEVLV